MIPSPAPVAADRLMARSIPICRPARCHSRQISDFCAESLNQGILVAGGVDPGRRGLAAHSPAGVNAPGYKTRPLLHKMTIRRRSIANRLHPVPDDPVDQLRIRQARLAR